MPSLRTTQKLSSMVVAALMLTMTGGCSSDEPVAGTASPSASATAEPSVEPSASATPSEPAEPAPLPSEEPVFKPLPKQPTGKMGRNGPVGRRAFAKFVVTRWGYALATNEGKALSQLGFPRGKCDGCAEFAKSLKERRKEGWYVDFPGAKVKKLKIRQNTSLVPPITVGNLRVKVPETRSLFLEGGVRNTNEAANVGFLVRMQYVKGRFRLLGFKVG